MDYQNLHSMRQEGLNGRVPLSVREIDIYLRYYPVDDVHYFIDLMMEIDRRGIQASSQNRRSAS